MEQTIKAFGRRPSRLVITFGVTLGALALLALPSTPTAPEATRAPADNKYIGAKKCKSCHDSEEAGNQFGAWESGPHAGAFETLGTAKAKEIASGLGIEDPQKADACLKCHTTAFGVDEKLIKRGFDMEAGVQCESCHGPGDEHNKARFKAAASDSAEPPAPGEIVANPAQAVCLECHNSESPTFEPFCYFMRVEKIRHLDPDTDATTKLVCGCGDTCPCTEGCPDDGCGVLPGK